MLRPMSGLLKLLKSVSETSASVPILGCALPPRHHFQSLGGPDLRCNCNGCCRAATVAGNVLVERLPLEAVGEPSTAFPATVKASHPERPEAAGPMLRCVLRCVLLGAPSSFPPASATK